MIRYEIAHPGEEDKILDFANYVFSSLRVPHDFRTLLPKCYAKGREFASMHYVAHDEQDNIRAMVAVLEQKLTIASRPVRVGSVGTVSVHPYARGEGLMKGVMQTMLEDSIQKGYDILVLGGNRQRYNYFGFEQAGLTLRFQISRANVQHALGGIDLSGYAAEEVTDNDSAACDFAWDIYNARPVCGARSRRDFLDCARSWTSRMYAVTLKGEIIGILTESSDPAGNNEILTADEKYLLPIIKYKMTCLHPNLEKTRIEVFPYEKERIAILEEIAEDTCITDNQQIRVLNFCPVIDALLAFNALCKPLEDGEAVLKIGEETLQMKVEGGKTSCKSCDLPPDLTLTPMQAQRMLFLPARLLSGAPEKCKNWLPLPWGLPNLDHF